MRAESFRLHVLAVPGSSLASVLVETRAEMSDVVGLETATSISIYITLFHHKLVDNKKMRKKHFLLRFRFVTFWHCKCCFDKHIVCSTVLYLYQSSPIGLY